MTAVKCLLGVCGACLQVRWFDKHLSERRNDDQVVRYLLEDMYCGPKQPTMMKTCRFAFPIFTAKLCSEDHLRDEARSLSARPISIDSCCPRS